VQIGTVPERLSALEKGRVQAAMLNPPDNVMAQKRGLNSLVDIRLPYQGVGVYDSYIYSGKSRRRQEVCQIPDRGRTPHQNRSRVRVKGISKISRFAGQGDFGKDLR
jgi:hypothetical protein